MLEFFRIVQNEWIKLFRRRRFLVVMLLGLAMVGVFTFAVYKDTKAQERNSSPEFIKQNMEQNIKMMEQNVEQNEKQGSSFTAEAKAQMEQEIQNQKNQLAKFEAQKTTEPVFDKADLQKQIDDVQKQMDNLPEKDNWQIGGMQIQKLTLEYKMAHQIPESQNPLVPHFVTSGWHGVKNFLEVGPAVFIPLLSVLLVADMVSGEQTGGTIKLLLIRPASRTKILFAKYVTSVTANLLVNVVLFALMTGLMLLIEGVKNGNDPTVVGVQMHLQTIVDQAGNVQSMWVQDASHAVVISMQQYAIDGMLLTLLATIAMCTLGFFCSVLVRSAAVSTGLAMGVVIIGMIFLEIGRTMTWKKYLITSDFNLPAAWSGSFGGVSGGGTLNESLIVLLVWTVVMYVAGHVLFRRRDILG